MTEPYERKLEIFKSLTCLERTTERSPISQPLQTSGCHNPQRKNGVEETQVIQWDKVLNSADEVKQAAF